MEDNIFQIIQRILITEALIIFLIRLDLLMYLHMLQKSI